MVTYDLSVLVGCGESHELYIKTRPAELFRY